MKIAISCELLSNATYTGVEKYLFYLVHAMASLNCLKISLICPPTNSIDLTPHNVLIHEHQIPNLFGAKYFWSLLKSPNSFEEYDLIHCPTVMAPFLFKPNKKIKIVMTVHDLVPALFPNFSTLKKTLYYKYALKYIFKLVDHFIVPSKSVSDDLRKLYSINQKRISIVYEGVSKAYHSGNCEKEDYILSVSTLEPRKNFIRIIESYIYLKKKYRIKENLLIVGKKGWKYLDILRVPNKFKENIIFKDYVPENHLIELYQKAKLLVYPSLYEGFGLPVVEAMACGCPVVTSNVSSLPEIAGDAALLVNPINVGEIAEAIYKILNNEFFATSLMNKGFIQAGKFSWKKCAQETKKIYDKVLAN